MADTAIKALCDMRPSDVPSEQVCSHCGKIAKGVTPTSLVYSNCDRDAPPIDASMLAMAKSGTKAGVDKLFGRTGSRDLMLQARIINVCGTCEHLAGPRCAKCGCWLKVKIAMDGALCPIGEWIDLLLEHGTRRDVDEIWKWMMEKTDG